MAGSMHSNVLPLLIAAALSCCASAQALSVSAACAQVRDEATDVYLEVRCLNEVDCGPAPESISIEFIGMDVGAFPVAKIAWIDTKGRASLDASKTWPRRMVWAAPQGFVVDARRALLSVENKPITPEFELRRDCRRLNAAALALLKRNNKEEQR